jgi:hypothetical protein
VKQALVILSLASLACWVSSCDKNPSGPVDPSRDVPQVLSSALTPDSLSLDDLTPAAGIYTITVELSVTAVDANGPAGIQQVGFQLLSPYNGNVISSGVMTLTSGPLGIYTAPISMRISRADCGSYTVLATPVGTSGLPGITVQRRLLIVKNSPPVIAKPVYSRFTPPGSDSTQITWGVAVSDSNGFEYVSRVSYRAINAVDTAEHLLYDDGNKLHGDVLAGDGIFSSIVWVKPVTVIENVQFQFFAIDRNGRAAIPVPRTLENHPPHITKLDVPTSITRPGGGTPTVVTFYVTVADSDGLSDIATVYFRNLTSVNPITFPMYDDGNFQDHGDLIAGDGIYSLKVQVDATTTTGPKDFHFFAVDKAGAIDEQGIIITIN